MLPLLLASAPDTKRFADCKFRAFLQSRFATASPNAEGEFHSCISHVNFYPICVCEQNAFKIVGPLLFPK